ncbi:MAG: FAD-dependent oxidoreductase, partial [Acidaminococcaceae bacterium]|nr:FAD-dependent oxidoreductase [Acidaminococcaceae bacterium]
MEYPITSTKYAGKNIPVLFTADVCIAGGGPSGTAAAIQAARNGARTVLIERGIALGGLAVSGCVYPFMDPHAPDSDTPYVAEIKERLQKHGIAHSDGVTRQTWHNPETLALIYDEMCEEAGVEILYQAVLIDTLCSGPVITTCIVQTIAGLAAIRARI